MAVTDVTTIRMTVASDALKLEAKLRAIGSSRTCNADRAAISALREARAALTNYVDGVRA